MNRKGEKMPTRSCVICRKKDEKAKLLRIVTNENNGAILDKNQKINKRAIYLCKNKECIKNAIKQIEKKKLKLKIGINVDTLKVLLNEVISELGE